MLLSAAECLLTATECSGSLDKCSVLGVVAVQMTAKRNYYGSNYSARLSSTHNQF